MSARKDLEYNDIYNTAKAISTEGSEIVMTIAEKLINEGLEKGREEGLEKTARSSLRKGLDLELIMEITGMDRKKLLELQKEIQIEDKE